MDDVYEVSYAYAGQQLVMTFTGAQEDGIPAVQKALDYYDAAMCTPHAQCTVKRNDQDWRDTRWEK